MKTSSFRATTWAFLILAAAACGAGESAGMGTGGTTSATGGALATGGAPATGGALATGGGHASGGSGPTGGTAGSGTGTGGIPPGDGGTPVATGGRASQGGGGAGGNGAGGRVAGGAGGAPPAAGGGGAAAAVWVGTWTAAPQLVETSNLPPASLANSVLRQVVHVSLGGTRLRVQLSNEFGNGPAVIKEAHVALCKANPVDSSIDATTDKTLAFAGAAGVSVPAGQSVWSDPLDFTFGELANLSLTIAFGAVPTSITGHPGSRTTSYQQTNSTNLTAASMASAQKADHWYYLSGIDVADPSAQAVAILGDSITDGRGTTTNGNNRWPDALAKRLQANPATQKVAVLNQGIGGNTLADPSSLGPRALDRYKRDILDQSGVRWVIVFEGVNDIGAGASAASVTAAYDQLIAMAHARQLSIYGATITPFNGNSYYTADHEKARQAVNTYIRSGKFDAVIDFDAAVRDPANQIKLQSQYDVDGLHMNPAGYQKLADTVDLKLITP